MEELVELFESCVTLEDGGFIKSTFLSTDSVDDVDTSTSRSERGREEHPVELDTSSGAIDDVVGGNDMRSLADPAITDSIFEEPDTNTYEIVEAGSNKRERSLYPLRASHSLSRPQNADHLYDPAVEDLFYLATEIDRLVALAYQQQQRSMSGQPINTGVLFVPQQEAWVIERFGKYYKILQPGLNFLIPIVDKVKYVQSLKEIAIEVPEQHAITADNVTLTIDGVLYIKVRNAYNASYGVEDPEFAITQLAQTTMRSEIGKIALDTVFKERDSLNIHIVDSINNAADAWGIDCLRYEIRDIMLPPRVQEAMQMQVEAERKKRAAILESEGVREADINIATGKKQARILNSEAFKSEQVNQAVGEAEALIAKARAQASSVEIVAQALAKQNSMNAVSMRIAEQYVSAFGNLAKKGNTVILPTNTGDVSSMVTQAMSIYNNLSVQNQNNSADYSEDIVDSVSAEDLTKAGDVVYKTLQERGIESDTAFRDDDKAKQSGDIGMKGNKK